VNPLHWLAVVTGLHNPNGRWATWWGGFGSDLPELAIFIVLYRKFVCHADGCHRMGLHHVAGTNFVTCRRHHPTNGNSVAQIAQAHQDAKDALALRKAGQ
jgi:hypothetical protein